MAALVEKGVRVELFNLAVTDIGKLAMALVDAATLVVGTPTVLAGPHPYAAYAAFLANALKPRVKFLSIVGSYGWGGKTVGNPCRHDPQSQRWRCWTRVLCKGAVENGFPGTIGPGRYHCAETRRKRVSIKECNVGRTADGQYHSVL
ncbi:MAG: hypothetical protein R2874_06735 [Desulfobacterales bacterium]